MQSAHPSSYAAPMLNFAIKIVIFGSLPVHETCHTPYITQ